MSAPQIIVIVIFAINFFNSAVMHGEDRGEYNVFMTTIDIIAWVILLCWGGFF